MKLTNHSKIKMHERASLKSNEKLRMYKMALKHGKTIKQIKNEKIKMYLAPKQKFNSRIILYQGYVFIHSKNSKNLYTMYKLPDDLGSEK